MKVALVLLALAAVTLAAPLPQYRRNQFNGFNGGQRRTSNVNAQVTNINTNQPNTLSFSGGLALASSQQVSAFGNNIGIDHAQAISQNIGIAAPPGFSQFNNYNRG